MSWVMKRPSSWFLASLTTALLTLAGSARANPFVVIEVDSGKVLLAEQATDPWYPASITKLMTAYVALKAVREGKIRMDSLLTVSNKSAALPPSKMGFKPGSQIRLDNALKIILVKSANDVANTIAEGVGGNVENFANMMNRNAQKLGMVNTHFVNPHGLQNANQQTTARDMAILGRALILEFPEYSDLFHIGAIQFGKRIMHNTNGLVGRYDGITGMKTGFICAAGFNLVASARRGNRQLITVVLGAPSATERTLLAASLLDKGFSSSGLFGSNLYNLPESIGATPPDMRSQICKKHTAQSEDEQGPASAINSADSDTAGSLNSSFAMGSNNIAGNTLGPRAVPEPQLVWLGLNPPSASEIAAAEEALMIKSRKGKQRVKAEIPVPPKPQMLKKPAIETTEKPTPVKTSSKVKHKGTSEGSLPPLRPAQIQN